MRRRPGSLGCRVLGGTLRCVCLLCRRTHTPYYGVRGNRDAIYSEALCRGLEVGPHPGSTQEHPGLKEGGSSGWAQV